MKHIKRNPGAKTINSHIISRSDHPISRANISENALKVLYRLKNAGYQGFLVGGGVRDLLLGREPKDFDIATNASPDEVRSLFRNCRLIGRRFRLAHIMFGREIIEVATFRAQANDDSAEDSGGIEVEESGRLLRDNVFGTLEEDAWRRDFTINALYYNIEDFSVADFTGGMADIEAGLLRIIGEPEQRFREDPVRMLRAVRFAAKIGFRIDEASEAKIFELGHLLDNIPAARLFDEVLKLFFGGCALQTFELLRHYNLFQYLFPQTEDELAEEENHFPHTMVMRALQNTDERIAIGKPVTPAFLYAALLWEPVRQEWLLRQDDGVPEQPALTQAAQEVVGLQVECTSLPRRFSTPMQEIWAMQPRLTKRSGKRAYRLMEHPRFRAAYDFLLLRAEAGEERQELADWWTEFQEVDDEQRKVMVRKLTPKRSHRSRRSSGKKASD
ncbi:MAG TPA: polynucleotide adenylyltransferase PcnB [Candidatus Tenderia electrophaga]|uniref:Poly(A) polymerase I n=1 Tax=Candidatus Tenderia electrophaga TaxID=1748243 RepID=A0A832J7W1_9GAMM|nr:polynucleotide adenylyltransferase PcnB [Candidatus Tenderia electrophaga]